jgi:tRNA 2-thiocytidine biosynthesis protein TtcA
MTRLEKRLLASVARASHDSRLLEPNDRVMVAVSGGKDSLTLLYLLRRLRQKAPFTFSLTAVTLDQGQPGFPAQRLASYFDREGVDYRIVHEDTYSIVQQKVAPAKAYCSLCSRLRRGVLYNLAAELGMTKLALAHHRDDVIETLLLNLLYAGQIKAMPPRYKSDDGRNTVIRPLVYCSESDIAAFARERALPVLPYGTCSLQQDRQRRRVRQLVEQLAADNRNVIGNLFAALGNVRLSHLLDRDLRSRAGMDLDGRFGLDPGQPALVQDRSGCRSGG